MMDYTPRSASVLLSEALAHLDVVQPESAREPIRMMFRSALEMCAISPSLLGKPVTYTLHLARAIVDAGQGG
jgi:hypothetical protein